MQTVTLYAEDFRTVHNTLCELREIEMRLNEVLSADMVDRLHRVVKGFEQGLANAYEQDHAAFEENSDHYEAIRDQLALRSIWSIYEVSDLNQQHPYVNAAEICYGDHWGDSVVYETIPGPTWADLYRAADRCIQRSGDEHHVFIESFETVADLPHQLRLTTGS